MVQQCVGGEQKGQMKRALNLPQEGLEPAQ